MESRGDTREKTKCPFELGDRGGSQGLRATIDQPYPLYTWVTRMGEKKYYYQAPTGFPDKGTYWINAGSLMNRMNFTGWRWRPGGVQGVKVRSGGVE